MTGEGLFSRKYRERFGAPLEDDHVHGYWTFLFGAATGVVALVFLFVSTFYEQGSGAYFLNRQIAFTLALLAGPVVGLSIVYLLPLQERAVTLALVGFGVCALAAVAFNLVYPGNWNHGLDYSAPIIALYAGGLGLQVLTAALYPLLSETPSRADGAAPSHPPTTGTATPSDGDSGTAPSTEAGGPVVSDDEPSTTETANATPATDDGSTASGGQTAPHSGGTGRAQFECYEDRAGKWRWRLRHRNGTLVADSGQGYADRDAIEEAVERIGAVAPEGDTLSYDPAGFELYVDSSDEWRWRLRHRNGRILADSGEGYASRSNARDGIDRVRDVASDEDHFEVYEDADGQYRWRLTAANGESIADSGEGYSRESNARDAVERVSEYAPTADTLDYDPAAYEIYLDEAQEWRWRLRHRNGRILADSGEGYTAKAKARQGIRSVQNNAGDADVVWPDA